MPHSTSRFWAVCLWACWGMLSCLACTGLATAPARVVMVLWDETTPNEAGFQEGLREAGLNVALTQLSVHGDVQELYQLLASGQLLGADLLYVSTATVLKAVLEKIHTIPIIFRIDSHAATHDIGTALKQQYPQITGICNNVQFTRQQPGIEQLLRIQRFGLIYDPHNEDAAAEQQYLSQVAAQGQFTLVAVPIADLAAIPTAIASLAQAKVDVVYLPPDPLVIRHSKVIVHLATQQRLPTFTGMERLVLESGALFALAGNTYELGKVAARQAQQILQGASPANIPVAHMTKFAPVINLETAQALNMKIPVGVLLGAKKVKTAHTQ